MDNNHAPGPVQFIPTKLFSTDYLEGKAIGIPPEEWRSQ
jgi:hypothetical protein